ncbi:unnamed protein product [Protopolystoma xenopodis]|uniref:Uncharacterized protein n=1 Tax=Protopolystoma xenopodis TaxID=117903 RepID=A0A448WVA3_9PLAT|nr:unnamed protein product [Protopolystoma xenopodis]
MQRHATEYILAMATRAVCPWSDSNASGRSGSDQIRDSSSLRRSRGKTHKKLQARRHRRCSSYFQPLWRESLRHQSRARIAEKGE